MPRDCGEPADAERTLRAGDYGDLCTLASSPRTEDQMSRPQPDHADSRALSILRPPYRGLAPAGADLAALPSGEEVPQGCAVVWELGRGDRSGCFDTVRYRPGGVALLMVLPPANEIDSVSQLLQATDRCRPHSVLPYHPDPDAEDLAVVLSRPPEDLPLEVMDYLMWRGIEVDLETRRLVRKTIELSGELRTVSGLARALYMSRRALGRRFRSRGLPVPSHLLHFSRVLRAAVALQTSNRSLFEVATEFDYPDGFALSNQMHRLTGLRPTAVREHLGWEWIVESWLDTERSQGRLEFPLGGEGDGPRPAQLRRHTDHLARPTPVWRRRTSTRSTAD